MKKTTLFVLLLMTALVISGFSSCLTIKGTNETGSAKNSLNWEGVYFGTVIMSGNGHAVNVRIRLYGDQNYEFNSEYTDGSYKPVNFKASFKWDDSGNIIMMDAMDAPVQYKVEKDRLIRLDENNYVLKKVR